MERELEVQLFDRKGKRVFLTEAGAYLKTEGARLLRHAASLQRQVRLVGGIDQAGLRIGFIGSLIFTVIPGLLSYIKEKHPAWTLEISEASSEEQIKDILDGKLDIGLIRSWTGNELIRFESLGQENLTIIYPTGYRLDGSQADVLEQFAGYPFIGFNSRTSEGLMKLILQVCERAGFAPRPFIEAETLYSIIKLVSQGLGWSIVPVQSGSTQFPEAIRQIGLSESVEIGLAYKKDVSVPRILELISLIREFTSKIYGSTGS